MIEYPFRTPVVPIEQPIGIFYVTSLPVRVLLETCYSERLRAERTKDGQTYTLEGSQRELIDKRLRVIGEYINTPEATFPNSVILAANFRPEDGSIEEDEDVRWRVESERRATEMSLIIPTDRKLTPIIDGQHRLFGFHHARRDRLDMELVCSVFLDLPKPFQAFLFATINSTQKPVDRSLTYELFGYNVESEPPERWSPDKLAVFLARKLNTEDESPLQGRIIVAAANEFVLSRAEARRQGRWMVSMATIVDGISRLISRNPKRDSYALLEDHTRNRSFLKEKAGQEPPPFRTLYIETRDRLIYLAVLNFLKATESVLWRQAKPNSFITKTVGIQALFDVLRLLVPRALTAKDLSVNFFRGHLSKAAHIDFAGEFFRNASGSGRTQMRICLEFAMSLRDLADLPADDRARYQEVCRRS